MHHNIILPDLGQTTSEAKIVQWLKKPGDHVSRGEPIVAVETDKVEALHITVGQPYFEQTIPVIDGQLDKAGYRLAALLNQIW